MNQVFLRALLFPWQLLFQHYSTLINHRRQCNRNVWGRLINSPYLSISTTTNEPMCLIFYCWETMKNYLWLFSSRSYSFSHSSALTWNNKSPLQQSDFQASYLVRGMEEVNEVLCKTFYDCIRQFWLLRASPDWKEAGTRLYTVNQPSRVCWIFDMHLHQ